MNMEWKFGLISREVEQISDDLFVIHDLSSGWLTAEVNRETLEGLMNGTISLTTLNWN